jgi:DNA-directed RNA polymerase sigma subunit (sigma70/sigma32)
MKPKQIVDLRARESWEECSDLELKEAIEERLRVMRAVLRIVIGLYCGLGSQDGVSYSLQEIAMLRKRGRSSIRQYLQMAYSVLKNHPGKLASHARDRGLA